MFDSNGKAHSCLQYNDWKDNGSPSLGDELDDLDGPDPAQLGE